MSTNLSKLCKSVRGDKYLYTSYYQVYIRFLRGMAKDPHHYGPLDPYDNARAYIRYLGTLTLAKVPAITLQEEDFAIKRMIEIATKTDLYDKR